MQPQQPFSPASEPAARTITLIRHGESAWNALGRWQGHGDAPLSDRGRRQAEALGARLGTRVFHRVEASDLQRAAHTAAALGHPVHCDAAWRELDVGLWEGLTDAEVRAQFPDELQALRQNPHQPWGRHGESLDALRVRARRAFDALVGRLADGEAAAVVCHGGLLLALVCDLLGMPERFPRPIGRFGNTSVTTVEVGPQGPRLITLNDVGHLAEPPERVREGAAAARLAGLEAEAAARAILGQACPLAPAQPGRVAHVVTHAYGQTLWDWNVAPDSPGISEG